MRASSDRIFFSNAVKMENYGNLFVKLYCRIWTEVQEGQLTLNPDQIKNPTFGRSPELCPTWTFSGIYPDFCRIYLGSLAVLRRPVGSLVFLVMSLDLLLAGS